MVALIRVIALMVLGINVVSAQSYDSLLTDLEQLEAKMSDYSKTISQLRSDYSAADDQQRVSIADRISNLEGNIIDVTQQINTIQAKIAQHSDRPIAPKKVSVKEIDVVVGSKDRKKVDTLYRAQIERLIELSAIRNSYDQSSNESEAMAIKSKFDSLKIVVNTHSEELAKVWSEAYDGMLYTMSLAIEQIDDAELRAESQKITRGSRASIDNMDEVADAAVVAYEYQLRELIAIELILARKLGANTESLSKKSKELSAAGIEGKIAPIEIEERIFIDYTPLTFLKTTSYNKSNPIPATKIFKRGVVYRILYGGFTTPQQPTLFRGAKPLSVDKEGNIYRYYGGGFKRYSEAVAAQKASKAWGFNRPEIVMWSNGKSRNLSRQPYAKGDYRVVVSGCSELPDGIDAIVAKYGMGSKITRLSSGNFVIAPLTDRMVAEDLAGYIDDLECDITIKIE